MKEKEIPAKGRKREREMERECLQTKINFIFLHTNRVENISGGAAIKDKIGNVKLCFYYSEIKLQKKIKNSLAMNVKIL